MYCSAIRRSRRLLGYAWKGFATPCNAQFGLQVCDSDFHRFRDAAITMILLERDGKQIDHNLLKNFSTFFLEIGESEKGSAYCKDFEQVLLAAADTSGYFSELASAWFSYDSSADYRFKIARLKFMMRQTESPWREKPRI